MKELQADSEDKKFGDVKLFIRLAGEEYESVWRDKDKADASILKIFIEGEAAKRDVLALKVPTYRHPDPYNNPIFCQFGVSRPHIQFRRLMQTADEPTMNDMRAVRMLLWHPQSNHAKRTVMLGMSKRLDYEIGSVPDQTERGDAQPTNVPRKGRLGFAAAGRTDGQTPTKVAGIFDVKRIEKRDAPDEDDGETEGEFKQPTWNGTLSADRLQLQRLGRTKSRAKAEELISGDVHKPSARADADAQPAHSVSMSFQLDAEKEFSAPAREKCFFLTSPLIEPAKSQDGTFAHTSFSPIASDSLLVSSSSNAASSNVVPRLSRCRIRSIAEKVSAY